MEDGFVIKGKGGAKMTAYSVLMSVYHKEKPEYFRASIQSMIDQTEEADEFVIVCDGPLTEELEKVLLWAKETLTEKLKIVRIPQNGGLGKALNLGLKLCKNELVARMDTDDISLPDRCEKQLNAFSVHPEVSIISGIVEEFSGDVNDVTVRRLLPERHEDIFEFAKKRNPFNHPCVMFKKSAVERAGGYQEFYLLEDYFLWIRMLLTGAKGMNLNEPILRMRTGLVMYKRRGGVRYASSQIKLFSYMKKNGMISWMRWIKSVLLRTLSCIVPGSIRYMMFKRLLRK